MNGLGPGVELHAREMRGNREEVGCVGGVALVDW